MYHTFLSVKMLFMCECTCMSGCMCECVGEWVDIRGYLHMSVNVHVSLYE